MKLRTRARTRARVRRVSPVFGPNIGLPIGHAKLYFTCGMCMGGGADTGVGKVVRLSESVDMGLGAYPNHVSCVIMNVQYPI